MYRILFEIQIRGIPSEMEYITKLREHLNNLSRCLGSATAYICFYKDVLVKLIPRVEESPRKPTPIPPLYESVQQTVSLYLSIEGDKVDNIAEITEIIYNFIRSHGLHMRLIE